MRLLTALSFFVLSACQPQLQGAAKSTPGEQFHQEFLFFQSHEDAARYFDEFEKDFLSNMTGQNPRKLVPSTDDRYTRGRKAVQEIWRAFRKIYPKKMVGLREPPHLLIVEDVSPNAMAFRDLRIKKLPYLFLIHSSFFDIMKTKVSLYGIVAHELTHLFFRHSSTAVQESTNKYYLAEGSEPLGFLQANRPEVEKVIKVSTRATTALNEMANEIFGYVLDKMIDQKKEHCRNMFQFAQFWGSFLQELENGKVSHEVAEGTRNFRTLARACMAGLPVDLLEILSKMTSVGKKKILAEMTFPEQVGIFDREKNIMTGVYEVVQYFDQKRKTAVANIPFDLKDVRIFTTEEEADDVTARVLLFLRIDPRDFLNHLFKDAAELDSCDKVISSGHVPDYGPLDDEHHSLCYRRYHLGKIVEFLQQ